MGSRPAPLKTIAEPEWGQPSRSTDKGGIPTFVYTGSSAEDTRDKVMRGIITENARTIRRSIRHKISGSLLELHLGIQHGDEADLYL